MNFILSFSPLILLFLFFVDEFLFSFLHVGENTQERSYRCILSFSPLFVLIWLRLWVFSDIDSCRGDSHGEEYLVKTLVLPLWTGISISVFCRNSVLCILSFCIWPCVILTFVHFGHFGDFKTPEVCHGGVVMHSGWVPLYCIYIV